MTDKHNSEERKSSNHQTLIIGIIWLITLAFLYMIFLKADAGLNLK